MLNWLKEKTFGKSSLMIKKLGRNGEVLVLKVRKIGQESMSLKDIVSNQSMFERFDRDEQRWLLVLASRLK
ncbi:MAG: hypothetical protein P8L77_03870 [Gammaproteobacteria bacterium]|nr:hypothetical protein [Gammaproteobacteria bacterium]